jgi:hypothetical protein
MIHHKLAPARVVEAVVVVIVCSLLATCEIATTTYEYHNPLDPREDGTVAEALTAVPDSELRRAISNSVNNETQRSKREVHWVHAAGWEPQPQGYVISNLSGIEFFSELSGIELSGNVIDWTANLVYLQRLPHLWDLSLFGSEISDSDLALISELEQLRYVGLGGNTITIAGLRHLAASNVDNISLSSYDDVGDNPGYQLTTGATIFEELQSSGLADQLWGVDLTVFDLTAADLTGLQVFPHLGSLGLWDNQIEGVSEINTYLRLHNEGNNPVHLGLGGNPIPEAELANLDLGYLSGLEIGNMGGDGLLLTAVPGFVQVGRDLRHLGLQDNRNLASLAGLEQLLTNSPIDSLNLSHTSITDVEPLLAGDELRWIYLTDLTNSGFSVANVELLGGLPNLEQLFLHNTPLQDEPAVRATFDARREIFVEYPDGSTNQL